MKINETDTPGGLFPKNLRVLAALDGLPFSDHLINTFKSDPEKKKFLLKQLKKLAHHLLPQQTET
jgi:hypothetical protein